MRKIIIISLPVILSILILPNLVIAALNINYIRVENFSVVANGTGSIRMNFTNNTFPSGYMYGQIEFSLYNKDFSFNKEICGDLSYGVLYNDIGEVYLQLDNVNYLQDQLIANIYLRFANTNDVNISNNCLNDGTTDVNGFTYTGSNSEYIKITDYGASSSVRLYSIMATSTEQALINMSQANITFSEVFIWLSTFVLFLVLFFVTIKYYRSF